MLQLKAITKTYDNELLLSDISLSIHTCETVGLLGPSGSGKTTLLRIIAGLEQPDGGEIFFDEQNMRNVPVHQRNFGMMFQDLALFPHQNVFENIAFGLRMQNAPREIIRARVSEMVELVGLASFEERNVNQLSGGEQQRVALARSLAPSPRFLMFDEPLGALDRILREQLAADLRAILKRIRMTALYVTHDQDEAFAIADRIAIIHNGHIVQIGTPEEIYRAPANAFVARFLGMPNLLPAQPRDDGHAETELGTFAIAHRVESARTLEVASSRKPLFATTTAVALIRPDRVRINATGDGTPARVIECTYRIGRYRLRVATKNNIELIVESEQSVTVGTEIGLTIDNVDIIAA